MWIFQINLTLKKEILREISFLIKMIKLKYLILKKKRYKINAKKIYNW